MFADFLNSFFLKLISFLPDEDSTFIFRES